MPSRSRIPLLCVAVLAAAALTSCDAKSPAEPSSSPSIDTTTATLTGPITGEPTEPRSASAVKLPANYVEQEFFAEGTAKNFIGTESPDGTWQMRPYRTAPYKTRILLRRPKDPPDFNGTVVVEWLNVSANEAAPDWTYLTPTLTDDGYAYIGLSAQQVGIDGGTSGLGLTMTGLKKANPARYGSLQHPGDSYAFDIFAQIGHAVSELGSGVNPSPTTEPLKTTPDSKLLRDQLGNAVGGVRTPAVDVPISALSGEPTPSKSTFCLLFGSTKAFGPVKLGKLYDDRPDYLAKYTASLDKAIAGGFIRRSDGQALLAKARTVQIP